MLAIAVNRGEKIRYRAFPGLGDFIEAFPEGVLEAHAGLVPPDDDGSFGISGFLQSAIHETTQCAPAGGAFERQRR